MKLELVSFALCPFVQRAVITLKHKKVPFTFKEIDLEKPPAWFNEISPLGRVPVLVVDGKTAVFESAVINEYLDETTAPHLHQKQPLQKALERSWIEYGSSLIGELYQLSMASEKSEFQELEKGLWESLAPLEAILGDGPFFRGGEFSLVDTAYAPLFMRMKLAPGIWANPSFARFPKIRAWAEALLALPEVKESVRPDFSALYLEALKEAGSLAL